MKSVEQYVKQYTTKTGSSVRNSQNQGNYFRKVIRSPRPTTMAKPINRGNYIAELKLKDGKHLILLRVFILNFA